MRRQNPAVAVQRPADVYVQEWAGPGESELGLQSALDMTDLTSIAEQADLSQKRFVAEKERTVLLQTTSLVVPDQVDQFTLAEQRKNFNNLTVPRRSVYVAACFRHFFLRNPPEALASIPGLFPSSSDPLLPFN